MNSFGERGKNINGVQYSKEDIEKLRSDIDKNDIKIEGKKNIFYIRGDLAPIVRGVFRKYVYSRRTSQYEKASFLAREEAAKYNLIDIDLPKDFPKDEGVFKYFDLEKK